MNKNKNILMPFLILPALLLSACSGSKAETLIPDLNTGLSMLYDSVSSKSEVYEIKRDKFQLSKRTIKDKDGNELDSKVSSNKIIINAYEHSYRYKTITVKDEDKLDSLSSQNTDLKPEKIQEETDQILKIDTKNHNFIYTFEKKGSKIAEDNGSYVFDLQKEETLSQYSKSRLLYFANLFIDDALHDIDNVNNMALDAVEKTIKNNKDGYKNEFYTLDNDEDHIELRSTLKTETNTDETNIEFDDGYVIKGEKYIVKTESGEDGSAYENSTYHIEQDYYFADRFDIPKAKEFIKITLDNADNFEILDEIISRL